MALSGTTEIDVQTGGSDNNGGGFDLASSGVDGSQSTTPIASYTDIVIGVTTTQGTSVIRPFVANDVGNILNVQSGTGFTVQRVQIVSVATGTATFDKTLGTTGSTGGTGILGGCLATVRPCFLAAAPVVAGTKIHIKAGTYTNATTITVSGFTGTLNLPIMFIGYQTTHNDGGTKPLLTTATNSIPIFTMTASPYFIWKNISGTNTAGTRAAFVLGLTTTSGGAWSFVDCTLDGFSNHIDSGTNNRGASETYIYRCTFKNGTIGVSDGTSTIIVSYNSVYYNNTSTGFRWTAQNVTPNNVLFSGNIFAKGATGFSDLGTTRTTVLNFSNNDFVDLTTVGINSLETTTAPRLGLSGNIFYNCLTGVNFAFSGGIDRTVISNDYNAYGANGTNRTGLGVGLHDVSLSVDPFTNRTTPLWTLNNTAGGGAACRATNFPGTLNTGGVGYLDIGALQHQDSGGSVVTVASAFS